MAEIYSKYFEQGVFFTQSKNAILGVVIHNDAGGIKARDYDGFLTNRVNNGTLANGFAAYYVDRNDIYVFQPSNHVEWHTANAYGNANFIGFEVCQSMTATDSEFLANEDAALLLAAQVLQSYDLPINSDTVKLHHEFSSTACPHRSMELHANGGAYKGAGTENCRQYFIKRMKELLNGETAEDPVDKAQKILDDNAILEKSDKPYYEATISTDYYVESAPDLNSEDKELLKAGTRVRVYEKRNGWSRINYQDSEQWIEDSYLIEAELL
ncbi:N-acetylmuramoyl-L-alanine amidase [Gemella bergeri]